MSGWCHQTLGVPGIKLYVGKYMHKTQSFLSFGEGYRHMQLQYKVTAEVVIKSQEGEKTLFFMVCGYFSFSQLSDLLNKCD